MKNKVFFSLILLFLIFGGISFGKENIYIPNKINIWLDKEFLKYYEHYNEKDVKTYSTDKDEKEIIKELIELLRFQIKTNLILIKQNERLIKLLEEQKKK